MPIREYTDGLAFRSQGERPWRCERNALTRRKEAGMDETLATEIESLRKLKTKGLRARFEELFGGEDVEHSACLCAVRARNHRGAHARQVVRGTPQRQVDWRDSGARLRCGARRRKAGRQSDGSRTGASDFFRLCCLLHDDRGPACRARTKLDGKAVDE